MKKNKGDETDRFILIDGDNLPDPNFFNHQLSLDSTNSDCAIGTIAALW
jgi:hypothetical protein